MKIAIQNVIRDMAGLTQRGVLMAIAMAAGLAVIIILMLVEVLFIPLTDAGIMFSVRAPVNRLILDEKGPGTLRLKVRSISDDASELLVTQQIASQQGSKPVPALRLVFETTVSNTRRCLRMDMYAYGKEGQEELVEWWRHAPVLTQSSELVVLTSRAPLRSFDVPVLQSTLIEMLSNGPAMHDKLRSAVGAPRLSLSDLELLCPEIVAQVQWGMKKAGRNNTGGRGINLVSGFFEWLIITAGLIAPFLIIARLLAEPKDRAPYPLFNRVMLQFVTAPPSLGMLGTVVGMISACANTDPGLIRDAVSLALGTTLLGVVPAVPTSMMLVVFRVFNHDMEAGKQREETPLGDANRRDDQEQSDWKLRLSERNLPLLNGEAVTYQIILDGSDEDGVIAVSKRELAKRVGISSWSAAQKVKQLEKAGAIRTTARPGRPTLISVEKQWFANGQDAES